MNDCKHQDFLIKEYNNSLNKLLLEIGKTYNFLMNKTQNEKIMSIFEFQDLIFSICHLYSYNEFITNNLYNIRIDKFEIIKTFLTPLSEFCNIKCTNENIGNLVICDLDLVKKLNKHKFIKHIEYIKDYAYSTHTEVMEKYKQSYHAVYTKIKRLMQRLEDIGIFKEYDFYKYFYDETTKKWNYKEIARFITDKCYGNSLYIENVY